jgi:hypothetical protein
MKNSILSVILGLVSIFFIGCAPMGGGSTRALNYTYQDSRGLTFISLFDMGTEAKGTTRTIGDGSSQRALTVSQPDFEALWGGLDDAKLTPYAVKGDSDRFNAKENYVIMKGFMPGGATTYVVPKSKAPAGVKSWIEAFKRKTQS